VEATVFFVFFDNLGGVGRAAVDDEEHRGGAVVHELGTKLDETRGVHAAFEDVKMNVSAW
jgi:hypothetical protein